MRNQWESPFFLRDSRASETRAPFLAWGDFHARSRFACSTIPEEKWGLLVVKQALGALISMII